MFLRKGLDAIGIGWGRSIQINLSSNLTRRTNNNCLGCIVSNVFRWTLGENEVSVSSSTNRMKWHEKSSDFPVEHLLTSRRILNKKMLRLSRLYLTYPLDLLPNAWFNLFLGCLLNQSGNYYCKTSWQTVIFTWKCVFLKSHCTVPINRNKRPIRGHQYPVNELCQALQSGPRESQLGGRYLHYHPVMTVTIKMNFFVQIFNAGVADLFWC